MSKKVCIFMVIFVVMFSTFSAPAYSATTTSPSPKTLTIEQIATKSNTVVLISTYDKKKQLLSTGSGFTVSADGKIVTNYHVIKGATSITATFPSGAALTVTGIVNFDENKDLAVLKVYKFSFVTLADSDKAALGQSIVAIGSPLGLQNTVSTGIISSIREHLFRTATNGAKDIQISAAISHGSSGGALFNMQGEVIGITYAGLKDYGGENLNFAIPINEVKLLLTPGLIPIIAVTKPDDISILQNYTFMLDEYKCLNDLANRIITYDWWIAYASRHSSIFNNTELIDSAMTELKSITTTLDSEEAYINKMILIGNDYSLYLSPAVNIIANFRASIKAYTDANNFLMSYYKASRTDSVWNSYVTNKSTGYSNNSQAQANIKA